MAHAEKLSSRTLNLTKNKDKLVNRNCPNDM